MNIHDQNAVCLGVRARAGWLGLVGPSWGFCNFILFHSFSWKVQEQEPDVGFLLEGFLGVGVSKKKKKSCEYPNLVGTGRGAVCALSGSSGAPRGGSALGILGTKDCKFVGVRWGDGTLPESTGSWGGHRATLEEGACLLPSSSDVFLAGAQLGDWGGHGQDARAPPPQPGQPT